MIDWNLEGFYPREYESFPDNLNIPDKYICDITHTIMVYPALCDDGNIYEYLAIKAWFHKSPTLPKTREPITNTELVRCDNLRSKIKQFVKQHYNTAVVNDPDPATTMAKNQATSTTAALANPAFQAPSRTTAQAEATMTA